MLTVQRELDADIGHEPTPDMSPAWRIGEAFLNGILLEVGTHPKPGLVGPKSNGAHRDMTLLTFMVGSAAIAPAFYLCAEAGLTHEGPLPHLLPKLRQIGCSHEERLLTSTKGVNTQRGALFLGGLLAGTTGFLFHKEKGLRSKSICKNISLMCDGIVARELESLPNLPNRQLTAGEQLYKKYGARGIRGEVEDGLPSIVAVGLPTLTKALEHGSKLNDAFAHTLISLLTVVEDTTILWRRGPDFLKAAQEAAQSALTSGGMYTSQGRAQIAEMDAKFSSENFSPGGCADLLSMTIALYLIEHGKFPIQVK